MKLAEILNRFHGLRPLVVGDLMLDEYIFGQATRISQEAPVMVVRQRSTRAVPGGAANVAYNMVALGARPTMVGVIGDDAAGATLADALQSGGCAGVDLVRDPSRPTTRKTRVLGNHSHQILRIDHEEDAPVDSAIEDRLLEVASARLPEADVVLLSDYVKGGVTARMIRELVRLGREHGVPVVANAKPMSLPHYRGATLVSLNRYEASDALGLANPLKDEEGADAARKLRDEVGVESMLVTLGGGGMAAAGEDAWRVPAVKVEVYDEAGAGDTVIATIALGIAARAFRRELLTLATQTAGAVVQKVGVAVPTAEDLSRIGEIEG